MNRISSTLSLRVAGLAILLVAFPPLNRWKGSFGTIIALVVDVSREKATELRYWLGDRL